MLQKIQHQITELQESYKNFSTSIASWISVFGDECSSNLLDFIEDTQIKTSIQNIAGVDVPIYEDLAVTIVEYDLVETPLWVDDGMEAIISVLKILAEIEVLTEQYKLIEKELLTTIQRVNLFEKVKIPETKHNIRTIQIYLGDQQTACSCSRKNY